MTSLISQHETLQEGNCHAISIATNKDKVSLLRTSQSVTDDCYTEFGKGCKEK